MSRPCSHGARLAGKPLAAIDAAPCQELSLKGGLCKVSSVGLVVGRQQVVLKSSDPALDCIPGRNGQGDGSLDPLLRLHRCDASEQGLNAGGWELNGFHGDAVWWWCAAAAVPQQ